MKVKSKMMFGKRIEIKRKDTGEILELFRFVDYDSAQSFTYFPTNDFRFDKSIPEFSPVELEIDLVQKPDGKINQYINDMKAIKG